MVIETRLSDFHEMCITVIKIYYSKEKASIIHFRKFKDFNNDSFIKTLLSKSFNEETIPFQVLREPVNVTLDKHAPSKAKYSGANQAPHMNEKLSKKIIIICMVNVKKRKEKKKETKRPHSAAYIPKA